MKPDAIVIAGDITQAGKRSEFEAARIWFDSLGAPVISAPGNHDTPVYHLPARMVAPFDRYERYMEGMDTPSDRSAISATGWYGFRRSIRRADFKAA